MLKEFSLQGVEIVALRQTLDGLDRVAFGLDREHQARTDQPTVDGDAAGAAVARTASFLAAGQTKFVAQHVEQRELRLAQKLGRLAIDGGGDVMFLIRFPARS